MASTIDQPTTESPAVAPRRALLAAGVAGVATFAMPGAAQALEPNSTADQSKALTRALRQATLSGETLRLPAGRFVVGEVELPAGCRIIGEPGATILAAAGPAPILVGGGGSVRLDGLVFSGKGGTPARETALLALSDVPDLAVIDCRFTDAPSLGLQLDRCGGRIADCRFDALDTALLARDSVGLAISGNRIADCANNGLLVFRGEKGFDGTRISGNAIERIGARDGGLGWNGNAINVFRAGNVTVSGNVMRDCAFSFIRANATDGVVIAGNVGRGAVETAIYVEFGFLGAVVSGNMLEEAAAGISVVNFNEGGRLASVTGNVCRAMKRRPHLEHGTPWYGTGIAVEADATVSGNTVEGCEAFGLSLGYGGYLRDIACTGNLVRDCGIGIAVTLADAARRVLIADNLMAGTRDGGIVGFTWDKRVSDDLAAPGATIPDGFTLHGNRVG
jgi:uncharacterized secreted repeat protein (TIGR03808 family)